MIVFCCVLPASNKARDDDDDQNISTENLIRRSVLGLTQCPQH